MLLGGDACAWKSWYKARFQYERHPDPNAARIEGWTREHDELVERLAVEERSRGRLVKVEEPFRLEGAGAVLSGKPDLVVFTAPDAATVVDVKTGRPKPAHAWQVRLYLYALAQLPAWRDMTLTGLLRYRDKSVPIELLPEHARTIETWMQRMGDDAEPPRVPSIPECRYCDVAACPDRVEVQTARTERF